MGLNFNDALERREMDYESKRLWNRKERQKHGFVFEELASDLLSVDDLPSRYTDEHDGFIEGLPVSFKTVTPRGEICYADYGRHLDSDASEILFAVGTVSGKKLIRAELFLVPGDEWRAMCSADVRDAYLDALASVTNSRDDDAKWTALRKQALQLEKDLIKDGTLNGWMRARPKRDHGVQKRLQSAMPRSAYQEMKGLYQLSESAAFSREMVHHWAEAGRSVDLF